MQTILGANGIIARELAKHLPAYTDRIRQVSRNPKKVNPSNEIMSADLLNYTETEKAVAGSDIVYLTAGLKYDIKVWRVQWPVVMRNVIDACKKHTARLVFFDNVYAYGVVHGVMTENTPFNPCSKKGEVRAKIATMLLDEIMQGNLQGMIVRSADFYGPGAVLSLPYSAVTQRLKAGKTPQWIGDTSKVHTFTYTPDAGKSMAQLANTPSAYNQTWHALTSKERITGDDYIRAACEIMKRPFKKQVMPAFGVSLFGLFVPFFRELKEMMYQYDHDYIFDSTKLEKAFNAEATSYKTGIPAATLQ